MKCGFSQGLWQPFRVAKPTEEKASPKRAVGQKFTEAPTIGAWSVEDNRFHPDRKTGLVFRFLNSQFIDGVLIVPEKTEYFL